MPQQQEFKGTVEMVQIAGRDAITHHTWAEAPPPDDPAVSTVCPQCRRLTWRYTQHCVHCQLDLLAWPRTPRAARLAGLRRGALLVLAVLGMALLGADGALARVAGSFKALLGLVALR